MEVLRYSDADDSRWDELISKAPMATFLHTRRYLSYHRDRFEDASVLITNDEGRLLGVLPAAVDKNQKSRLISHPGITYGGLLHDGSLRGQRMLDAFEAFRHYYREQGFEVLRYKAVPSIYHLVPSADDLYALFRLKAARYRCDLSCAIDLDQGQTLSERRRRGLKKARKNGVEVAEGAGFIQPLWQVVEDNLARKFNLRPVHTVDEIAGRHSLFPENIEFVVALLNSEVVAGIVIFITPAVVHVQYTAASETGQDASALDAVFEYSLGRAKARGARYFDFGISNEQEGQYLNQGLYQYKSEFGGGGVVHEFYELDMRS